ncbi:hypothetical protein F2P56_002393 [Juglans regia]|uniref:Uncharacterized protein LOC109008421 n=2 Tax=Juglans regia TaxID=51240 RepID=A0A2I4GJH5_JUGRE|nr:uncharacterized protein LOC109008421 [Juglans regia]KAF5481765.1 hypothetical protein F2P56_002393 [Juglans regia]
MGDKLTEKVQTLLKENEELRKPRQERDGGVKSTDSEHAGSQNMQAGPNKDKKQKNIQDKLRNLKGKYEEIARKLGTLSTMDQLHTSTGLPYMEEVMAVPIPPKFKVLAIEIYDGERDPLKHLETFRAHMTLHGFPGEVACRAFPLTFKGPACVWFISLAPGSVDSFGELTRLFLTQFMSSRRRWRLMTYLLTIKQAEDESLKSYLSRFNKECIAIVDQDEKITLAALLGGVWPRSQFMAELARRNPMTLREFMDHAEPFINVEYTFRALTEPRRKELEQVEKRTKVTNKAKPYEKPKKSSQEKRWEEVPTRGSGPRYD